MEFRTPVAVPPSPHPITLHTPVLAMGSCFAEVMGERLAAHKFTTQINPFGVIFNPVSLAALLDGVLAGRPADRDGLVHTREGWRHYDFHSRLGAPDPDSLLVQADAALAATGRFLAGAGWLLLTLGTAFAYRRRDNGAVVANCHKVPNASFAKELLPLDTIVGALDGALGRLADRHPHLRILLTVSPVRHTRDTLPLNAVSKSLLRVACHELVGKHRHVQYFPAYEIMLDDLRDYRFYKPDMIHPSEVAEAYIWQKLAEAYFDEPTRQFIREWTKLHQALGHRPFNPHTEAHQTFLRSTLAGLEAWRNVVPLEAEIAQVSAQLASGSGPRIP
ncbi:MAG TPA: GSCFA domain-containing protein [Cytophagales bacterium]|jgi:hypothetical protein